MRTLVLLSAAIVLASGCGQKNASTQAPASSASTPASQAWAINDMGALPSNSEDLSKELQRRAVIGEIEAAKRTHRLAASAAETDQLMSENNGESVSPQKVKTYKGMALDSLLSKHGLKVVSVNSMQANSATMPDTQPGDVVVTMQIVGKAKGLPCDLDGWIEAPTPDNPYMAEALFHRGALKIDSKTDKLLYWARTGKCQKN
jgi:hypothetical protein